MMEQRVFYGGEMWQSAIALAKEGLKAAVEAGQPTVLLDEPEAGLSLVWQAKLWELLRDPAVAQRYQVIVATHSVFGLDVPGATYVDMATATERRRWPRCAARDCCLKTGPANIDW